MNDVQHRAASGNRSSNLKHIKMGNMVFIALFATLFHTVTLAREMPGSKQAKGKLGMVAAAHPLAAQAGIDMLNQGGNAVDAAVATAFALTVVEPFASSIGGDGGALIYMDQTKKVEAFGYRCKAPASANYETYDYNDKDSWNKTIKGAGVPGMVAGTCMLHKKYGRLPLATVLAPAIRYAEEGFAASEKLANIVFDAYDVIDAHESTSIIFLDDGLPIDPGFVVKNPDLAASLRLIAAEGPDAFYKGKLAAKMSTFIQANGGHIGMKDFADYTTVTGEALKTAYRGLQIYSAPPPFGGLSVLMNLKVISKLPLDYNKPYTDPQNIHLMAEAMKGVAKDRNKTVGDPEFDTVPVDYMLSDGYADKRARLVDPKRAIPGDEVQSVLPDYHDHHGSTTHLSVIDAEGNAVAITQTLGNFFGCGVVIPGTGILFNNQMKNFAKKPGVANALEPGKRMRSTQAPTIITRDGNVIMVVGTPGAYRIITTMVQIIVNNIDYGMSLWDAVDAARFSARHSFSGLRLEKRFPAETRSQLRARGHQLELYDEWDLYFGGVHAIVRDPVSKVMMGSADRRRDGVVMIAKYKAADDAFKQSQTHPKN